jgi:hypothetical protein
VDSQPAPQLVFAVWNVVRAWGGNDVLTDGSQPLAQILDLVLQFQAARAQGHLFTLERLF